MKINLVSLNKIIQNKNKNFFGMQNAKTTPVITNVCANSLPLMSNYAKGSLNVSFKGNSLKDVEEREEAIRQLKYRDGEGNKRLLFDKQAGDIQFLVWDEAKYQKALKLAGYTYVNSKGLRESVFQDGSDIIKIIKDDNKAYERALELLDFKYTNQYGKEEKVFIEGNAIKSLSINERAFGKAKSLAKIKFKNSDGVEESVFQRGYEITRLARDLKFNEGYDFIERTKKLAGIRFKNILGEDERVFEDRDIAEIARSMYPEINNHFMRWTTTLASVKYKNLNDGYDRALFSDDIKAIALDREIKPESFKEVGQLRQDVLSNPDSYVNGYFENDETKRFAIDSFFDKNFHALTLSCSILGKKLTNELLKERFEEAEDYLDTLLSFNSDKMQSSLTGFGDISYNQPPLRLLRGLLESNDKMNRPFSSKQKIEFIDLVAAYKNNEMDTSDMSAMIENEQVDINKLNLSLLYAMLSNMGFSGSEITRIPKEKLNSWNMKYIHLLSKEISEREDMDTFRELFKASSLYDFKKYIENTSTPFGRSNKNTKSIFQNEGIDYDKWFNPSETNNVQFMAKDRNTQIFLQMADQTEEDIEELRNGPVKNFIDKCLSHYIKNNEFKIPLECRTSKAKLIEFSESMLKQLENVFNRAESNKHNPDKMETSYKTLTIKNHFLQRIADMQKMSDFKTMRDYDLTIKMWDRIPQKDIFQGNYSTCCIGMGEGNGAAMPHYLMNTAFNMIELVDNQTQNTIGNALCYFIKTEDDKLGFVIDNVEIKNSRKMCDEVGLKLRETIAQFAKQVSCDVTGCDDVKIYMGVRYNDIPTDDLEIKQKQARFLGDIDNERIYLDLYGGAWRSKDKLNAEVNLYEIG